MDKCDVIRLDNALQEYRIYSNDAYAIIASNGTDSYIKSSTRKMNPIELITTIIDFLTLSGYNYYTLMEEIENGIREEVARTG